MRTGKVSTRPGATARLGPGAYHGPVSISPPSGRDPFRPWMLVGSIWVTLAIASGLLAPAFDLRFAAAQFRVAGVGLGRPSAQVVPEGDKLHLLVRQGVGPVVPLLA